MIKKALIIAAGLGSRLDDLTKDKPKPLVDLCGLTILERIILSSSKAGIKEFHIVVGYKKEALKKYFGGKKYNIKWIDNPEWMKANGVSVYKAKESLAGSDFILLMSDHIFSQDTINRLVHEDANFHKFTSILAVDVNYKNKKGIDLDDATKVVVEDGKILDINKNLKEYNGIDTGMFACSGKIFEVFDKIRSQKEDFSLSEANKEMIKEAGFGAFDVGDNFWQDIDTKEDLKNAEKKLFNACRKPTDGLISRNFNRHISIAISKHLCKTRITPNQISLLVLLTGVLSALAIATPNGFIYIIGMLLYKFVSILDGCDGEIAKVKFSGSKYGDWIDTACDNFTGLLFFIALGYSNFQDNPTAFNQVLWYLAPILYTLSVGVLLIHLKLFEKSGSIVTLNRDFAKSTFTKIVGRLIQRDMFTTIFVILGIFSFKKTILVISILGSVGIVAYSANKILSKIRTSTTP